jgi:class 3 adenylate cyclase
MGAAVLPETKYARLRRARIAYQVLGAGPLSLVMTPGSFGHVDIVWEDPAAALFLRTLASFSQVIRFDRRGTGASDPVPLEHLPPWESYAEDLAAVLDQVGVEQTAVMAGYDAGPMAMFFAATRPQRTSALILANTTARWVAANGYPIGIPRGVAEVLIAGVEQAWGTEALVSMYVPSRAADQRFCRWFAKLQRTIASPSTVEAFLRAMLEADARPLLPLIQAPTLVLHRRGLQALPIQHGRWLAEHISGAMLVELPGADVPLMWETPERVLEVVEEFLTGVRRTAAPTRVLATVLFTDLVGSTERARELGDRRWRRLLDMHDELAQRVVEAWDGRLVKTTGDGLLATFDGPGRGIRCAAAFREELHGIGLQLRAGLHTGEVELRDDDLGGIGVHLAARVMAAAPPGEIFTSRTVRDLVVGSDVELQDRGAHALKGTDERWQLFAITRP